VYDELLQAHRTHVAREREKQEYAFAARRRAVERTGLAAVRHRRLAVLDEEEREWGRQLQRRAQAIPEMLPVILARLE
jgi:hypothetical protein